MEYEELELIEVTLIDVADAELYRYIARQLADLTCCPLPS